MPERTLRVLLSRLPGSSSRLSPCTRSISASPPWAAKRGCASSPPRSTALRSTASPTPSTPASSRSRRCSRASAPAASSTRSTTIRAPTVPPPRCCAGRSPPRCWAAERSGGLVDATLLGELERHGYEESWDAAACRPRGGAGRGAPRRPARPARWRIPEQGLTLDAERPRRAAAGRAARPRRAREGHRGRPRRRLAAAGVRYAISCGGDVAVGGGEPWDGRGAQRARRGRGPPPARARRRRGDLRHRRSHLARPDGGFAHHVLDPATGRPAWTGLVAATAVADGALEAEVLAKPRCCPGRSPHGGCCAAAAGCSSTTTGAWRSSPRPP